MQAELLALLKRTLATITGRENLSIKGLCTWKLNNYSTVPSFLSVGVLPPLSEIFHSALFQGVDVHLFQTDFQKYPNEFVCSHLKAYSMCLCSTIKEVGVHEKLKQVGLLKK